MNEGRKIPRCEYQRKCLSCKRSLDFSGTIHRSLLASLRLRLFALTATGTGVGDDQCQPPPVAGHRAKFNTTLPSNNGMILFAMILMPAKGRCQHAFLSFA